MNDDRFSAYGKLAPSSKADFALCNMVHQLDDNGTMAIVFPTVFCFVVVQKVTYASI
jgi:type I restriction enzyme M protein